MNAHVTANSEHLVLVVDDNPAMQAAAKTVRGWRFVGRSDGCAVYEYPRDPDVARDLVTGFGISPIGEVGMLAAQAMALDDVAAGKHDDAPLPFNPWLRGASYAHQERAMRFCWERFESGASGAGLFMEQGTGKTRVAIGLANALCDRRGVRWVLVICPNSVKGTWGAADGEIVKHSAFGSRGEPTVEILRGPKSARAERVAARRRSMTAGLCTPTWLVTNFEQFAVDPGDASLRAFAQACDLMGPGLLVIDESTRIKSAKAKRTRAIAQLRRHFRYCLVLTGTPLAKAPLDFFSQFEVMQQGALGYSTYLAFERAYASYQERDFGYGRVKTIDGFRNLEDLERRSSRLSFRVRAADCLDLPPVTVQRIDAQLSPEQARLYRKLRDDMVASVGDGSFLDGRNVLSRYLRMAQLVGGFVGTVDELGFAVGTKALDPNPKMAALLDFLDTSLEDPDRKVVVFCQFVPEVLAVVGECEARGWKPVAFHGAVKEADRDEGRRRFASDPGSRVFVAQYQCGALGLNLTAADTLVFYSLTFSFEDFAQAQKRVHRLGQQRHVTEAYVLGTLPSRAGDRPTVDHLVLEALRSKKNLADVVTGDRAAQAAGGL